MKHYNMSIWMGLMLLLLFTSSHAAAKGNSSVEQPMLTTYAAPEGAPLNDHFLVRVRQGEGAWQEVPTFAWKVDRTEGGKHASVATSVASFDFRGEVEVEVTALKTDISSHQVRPASYAIASQQQGRTITFRLDRPRHLSVEINGDRFNNLQLFANAPAPKVKKGKKVRYFGPGYYDLQGDSIGLKSGETLYVDGGAYVKGWVSAYGVSDVKIIGNGIINPERPHEGIMVRYSKRVSVDGPVTTQLPVGGSDSVNIKNVKVLSWYQWGDGMNVFASNNVSYDHVFVRTSDDCSTIYCTRKDYRGGCRNIRVHDAVYWADVAHPIMIGLHGDIDRHEVIENVVYDEVDVLDQAENQIDYQGVIGINNGDNITVRNVTFRNFRIEPMRAGMLFNMRVCYNKKYCSAPGAGIENVTLENISYDGQGERMGIITGYNEQRRVRGIHFKNFSYRGRHISDTMPDKLKWYKTSDYCNLFIGEHVEDVTFE